MIKIQLLDDEPGILSALRRTLRHYDWDIHTFTDPQDALHALSEHDYAVIVTDYKMPSLDGITYLEFAMQRRPHAVRMVLSGHADREAVLRAITLAKIYRFLPKPWEEYEFETALKAAVDLYELASENRKLNGALQEKIQQIDAMKRELYSVSPALGHQNNGTPEG